MEARVGAFDDLPIGSMRKVMAGETPCLLVRLADGYHAYPAACPHYHGPLPSGVLHDGRVTCPWHQAVFAAADGDLLEPPSFFALAPYPVRVAHGSVYVEVADDAREQRGMPMTAPSDDPERTTVLILGAGAAGAGAVEALRQAGFSGRIIMVGAEDHPPYDRPNCSKDLLAGAMPASWMPLRSPKFYEKHGVERVVGQVTDADAGSRSLTLSDGTVLTGDSLLLAPGGVPRRLTAPGADQAGVFTLRTWDDCEAIVAALGNARTAVVAGASFIGLEAAASLRRRGLDVTIVAPEAVPFARLFGDGIGSMIRTLHEERGVSFRLGRVVAVGGEGRVRAVTLDDGEGLPADVVVAGIGIVPATHFVRGLDLLPDGSIPVDEQLRAAPGVWAAGDVATYPAAHLGEPVRIEHWRLALQHGRAAGFAMAGRGTPFTGVPFFWSQQYDVRLGFAGYGGGWDRLAIAGDIPGRDFVAYFCAGDTVRAACGTRDRQVATFAELMHAGALPAAGRLAERPETDLTTLLA